MRRAAHQHDLAGAERKGDASVLGHDRENAGQLAPPYAPSGRPQDDSPWPGRRTPEARKQRRLAGAVRPAQRQHLAGAELERHAAEHWRAPSAALTSWKERTTGARSRAEDPLLMPAQSAEEDGTAGERGDRADRELAAAESCRPRVTSSRKAPPPARRRGQQAVVGSDIGRSR